MYSGQDIVVSHGFRGGPQSPLADNVAPSLENLNWVNDQLLRDNRPKWKSRLRLYFEGCMEFVPSDMEETNSPISYAQNEYLDVGGVCLPVDAIGRASGGQDEDRYGWNQDSLVRRRRETSSTDDAQFSSTSEDMTVWSMRESNIFSISPLTTPSVGSISRSSSTKADQDASWSSAPSKDQSSCSSYDNPKVTKAKIERSPPRSMVTLSKIRHRNNNTHVRRTNIRRNQKSLFKARTRG